jgi:RNA polymerase sigma factor (TIGR02999 family)
VIKTADDVTGLLADWRHGDRDALVKLMPLVYAELRRLARRTMARERGDHTLEPTALVHELYLRLADTQDPPWQSRGDFFRLAARLMRQLLVDHARAHGAAKRGGGVVRIPLGDASPMAAPTGELTDLLALDEALQRLAAFDRRKAQVLELRTFGGLTIGETAQSLGVSTATVILDARLARAWLSREMMATNSAPVSAPAGLPGASRGG